MKAKWQHPKVLTVDQAGEVWGDCFGGSTPTDPGCTAGQRTADPSSALIPHACFDGGYAAEFGGCSTGTTVLAG